MDNRFLRERLTRRSVLRLGALAGVGLSGLSLIACDDDSSTSTAQPSGTASTTSTGTATATGSATGTATSAPTTEAIGFGIDADPFTIGLNPLTSGAGQAKYIYDNIFDGYFNHTQKSETVPGAATGIEILDNGMRAVVTLREGVTFHNGEPMTVDDAKFTLDKGLDKEAKTYNRYASLIERTEATSPTTLTLYMKSPDPLIMEALASNKSRIVPMKAYEAAGDDGFAQNPIGTGPFRFTSQTPGQSLQLDRFDQYWDGPASMASINVVYAPENAARIALLDSGDGQIISKVPTADAARIRDGSDTYTQQIKNASIFLAFQLDEPFVINQIVKDIRFRQAMNYAVDKAAISTAIYHDFAEPVACQSFAGGPPGFPDDVVPYPYDVAQAKQLIEASGYGGETIKILYTSDGIPEGTASAQALKQYLDDAGVANDIVVRETSTWLDELAVGHNSNDQKYDLFITYGSPSQSYDWVTLYKTHFGSGKENPYSYYTNPDFDKMIADAEPATGDDRKAKIEDMTRFIHDQALGLWLWSFELIYGLQKRLVMETAGIERNPRFHEMTFSG